jgi:putative tricarboxylic transport membrane protein
MLLRDVRVYAAMAAGIWYTEVPIARSTAMTTSIRRKAARAFAAAISTVALGVATVPASALAAWEPTKPITFVVTGGAGGGADQMARLIQGIAAKHKLTKQPFVVQIMNGGGGGQGFMDVKNSPGDPHKVMIVLSNAHTVPMSTKLPFNWRDITPVALMALDEFVLWVNAKSPYRTSKELIDAMKKAAPGEFKFGGAGRKREDELVAALVESKADVKFTFIPYKGGGEISAQLVGGHIEANPNNPIEHVSHWKAGQVRPLCVLNTQRMPFKEAIAEGKSWNDIPTCKEQGLDAQYTMLRAIMMPKGVTQEQLDYYVNVLGKVRETPEWKEFVERGAYNNTFLAGNDFRKFLEDDEKRHKDIMQKAGFLAD